MTEQNRQEQRYKDTMDSKNAPTGTPVECLARLVAAAMSAVGHLRRVGNDALQAEISLSDAIDTANKMLISLDGPVTDEWAAKVGADIMPTSRSCYRIMLGHDFGLCPPCGDLPACLTLDTRVIKCDCTRRDVLLLIQMMRDVA